MRRVILLILTTLCCIPFVQAQDIITTKDGKDIQSKILEVNANEVKYKKYNNLDGPTFTLSKSEILIVRYENGENEVFQEHNNSVDKKYNTTAEVVVGMRYREYKNLYNTKEYVPQRDDPYSRAWAGIASFIIPGLGQGIVGQWGRGFAIIGTNVGLLALQLSDTYIYDDGTTEMGGLAWGAFAARLALNIWSICDAGHIAKVKNMYYQDLRTQRAAFDLKVEPYFAYTPTSVQGYSQPTAGLSLKLNF